MAKQTFTTGQVLTAAQMTSLQQTAMGGGSPSTKTASYVLTAADAGTVIQMNSASATTITVNTSLFAAGDSVQIQNIGAGVMTITAGTATVNSAGSLGVTQYDGGFLYFSSTSSAIWFDFTQAGTTLPLTTKGDLFGYDTGNARIPVGADATVLTADSTQALGVKWAAPASGGMTLISTTTLTGASITLSSIPQTYNNLYFVIRNYKPATDDSRIFLRPNSDSGASRYKINTTTVADPVTFDSAQWDLGVGNDNSVANALTTFTIPDYFNTVTWKNIFGYVTTTDNTTTTSFAYMNFTGSYNQTAAISSMLILPNSGNFTSGEVLLYGVK